MSITLDHQIRYGLPEKQGLYDPAMEKDSCGVGFVAHIKGEKSHEIVRQGLPVRRQEMDRMEAIRLFQERKESYKVEMLEELDAPVVSVYGQEGWVDLCRGPHLNSTSEVKMFSRSIAW